MNARLVLSLCVAATAAACATVNPAASPEAPLTFSPVSDEALERCSATISLPGSANSLPVVFCRVSLDQEPEHEPALLRYSQERWEMARLPTLKNHAWVQVAPQHGSGRIWALATFAQGDAGDTFEVVFSPDGGHTFSHVASVKKVYYMADFVSFRMDSTGRGSLVEYLEPMLTNLRGGYYTHRTSDWGRTWSAPEYGEDVLDAHRARRETEPLEKVLRSLAEGSSGEK